MIWGVRLKGLMQKISTPEFPNWARDKAMSASPEIILRASSLLIRAQLVERLKRRSDFLTVPGIGVYVF
jgi:hypothetical protein